MLSHFSRVQLFETLWTVAYQAPLSIEFSRQENWSGLPCLPSGDLSHPGIKPTFPATPALQVDSLPLSHWKSHREILCVCVCVCVYVCGVWLDSPWNSPGQNTAVGNRSLLQGIFPTEGWNPGLPHCRQISLPAEPSGFIYLKDGKRINLKRSHHKNEMLIIGHDGGVN